MSHSPASPSAEGAAIPDNPDLSSVRWLIDGYEVWAEEEGIPIVEDVAIDLPTVETSAWPRMGVDGAFVHSHARGDYCSIYILDIPPGARRPASTTSTRRSTSSSTARAAPSSRGPTATSGASSGARRASSACR